MISTKPNLQSQIAAYQGKQRRRQHWYRIVSALACVVVFCTTYALILPAITMETQRVLDCRYEVHTHTDECYDGDGNLICGQADFVVHVHNDDCYDKDGSLVCPLPEIEAHTHADECYAETRTLICELDENPGHQHTSECYAWTKKVVCGQEESEGHAHSDECYKIEYDGETGEELARTLICLQEEHPGHLHTDECYEDVQELACGEEEREPGHIHTEECYEAALTLACEKEEVVLHTHTDDCYDADGNLVCGQLEILEHVHTDACFHIVEQSAPVVYSYEDETIAAEVTLAGDSTLPEGTELVVRPITGAAAYSLDGETDDDGGYEDLVRRAEEAVGQPVTDIVLYDISFYTPDGEYLPVEDTATVSLRFKEAVFPEGTGGVTVLHYAEDEDLPEVLEAVDVTRDENDAPAALTFQTEGFSVYGIAALADEGNTFTLTYGDHTITFSVVDVNGKAISEDYSDYNISAEAATKYLFSEIAPGIEGYTYSGAKYGTNVVSSVATTGFSDGSDSWADIFRLYVYEPIQSGQWYSRSVDCAVTLTYISNTATDYTGDWAIVNRKSTSNNSGVAMLASGLNGSDTANRAGQTVTLLQSDEGYSVADSTVTVWHFEKQENGTYCISTTVDSMTKYLTIGTSAVTLSDIPQDIIVTEGTGTYAGMVRLTNSSGGMAVNLYGGSADQGFGSYSDSGANEWQTLCQPLDASVGVLCYDLDVSTTKVGTHLIDHNTGSDWEVVDGRDEEPQLTDSDGNEADSPIQTVSAEGTALYSPGTPGDDGYFTHIGASRKAIRTANEKNIGTDFRFDGWAATVGDETWLFAENAEAVSKEDGIHIKDTGGMERTLPSGTTLKAQWTEVSGLVLFFVNYSGTVLDTEGDVSGRNQSEFTGIIGIGRVYYGKEQAGKDGVFGNDANESIRLKFVNKFDPDDPETQIVMEYVTSYDANIISNATASDALKNGAGYYLYQPANGINDTELETDLLRFIQANENVTIKVSTADNANNPEIENENSTPDNYSVRWYVMKEQEDAWHIDGVMVAKTQEVAVAKTFSGLTADQVKGLLNEGSDDGFSMPVKLGKNRQAYITMTTQSIDGQYEYVGQEVTGGQSYDWTLHAITDEQYTLSEENYDLDGYDVSAVVVHYYRDENGQLQISYQAGSTTEGLTQEVLGGKTVGVSFNNFYTRTGTGAFAIHKSSTDRTGQSDVGSALQGATFTLYNDEDCADTAIVSTSTTNTRGSAYFNNLTTGTYYLKETAAPNGYVADASVWKVVVADTGTEGETNIKVTVSQYRDANGTEVTDDTGTVCYDGGIAASYEIHNTPIEDTVRVTKTFSGLTTEQLNALVRTSTSTSTGENSDGYYIEVSPNSTASPGADGVARLYLQQSTRSQDGWTFTWVISDLDMTDSDDAPISYNIVEHNYFIYNTDGSLAYKDVATTAVVNGATQTVEVKRSTDDSGRKCAEATVSSVTFHTDRSDLVELTNHYTNTFDLTLKKVDAKTGTELPNAVFDIYGSYSESTESAKQISYTDPETGTVKTAYYIGTITADENGIATKTGLNLSEDGSATFVYVINESFSPDGYAKLDEPIVQTVTVSTDGYAHGVYTADVPNTKEQDYVHAALNTVKVWNPDTPPAGATVTLELYRVTHDERGKPLDTIVDAVLVESITLDGTIDTKPEASEDWDENTPSIDKVQVYESESWVATWMNLYSASRNYSEEDPAHYHYFVREVMTVNGYAVSYTCYDASGAKPEGAFQTLQVDGQTFQGVLIADMDEAYTVTVVNTTSFELPETGGMGTFPYAIGGTLLMAGCLLCGYKLRHKSERRYRR